MADSSSPRPRVRGRTGGDAVLRRPDAAAPAAGGRFRPLEDRGGRTQRRVPGGRHARRARRCVAGHARRGSGRRRWSACSCCRSAVPDSGWQTRRWLLDALRFAQGAGGAIAWNGGLAWLAAAAAPERRGELLGIAFGAAVTGALLGPLVGGAAGLTSRPFAFVSVATLGVILAVWAARTPAPPRGVRQPLALIASALRSGSVIAGFWLIALPAVLFGALSVLGPLSLDNVGVGALGLTIFWLVSAAFGAAQSPFLGRWSDRRGRLEPIRAGLSPRSPCRWRSRSPTIARCSSRSCSPRRSSTTASGFRAARRPAHRGGRGIRPRARLLVRALQPRVGAGRRGGRDQRRGTCGPAGDAASYVLLAAVCGATLLVITPGRIAIARR